jgi:hypothetical protein
MFIKKAVLALALLFAALEISGCMRCAEDKKFGERIVCVRDGFTDEPIRGALVVIPEAGIETVTGPDGGTTVLRLPIIPDAEYEKLLPANEGRVTVLVYADGKTPYLLLYARVREGELRKPQVLMFPSDGSMEVFPVCEAPGMSWCEELARMYGNRDGGRQEGYSVLPLRRRSVSRPTAADMENAAAMPSAYAARSLHKKPCPSSM